MAEFIETIKNQNQYPIVFIGSGITQRYFTNAPTWEELLKKIWNMVNESSTFYATFHELATQNLNSFEIYTTIAEQLEQQVDTAFYKGTLEIPGLTVEQAHNNKLSPFRALISNIFANLELKDEMEEELLSFKNMLSKSRIIITTNYDTFIEDTLHGHIKVNVGNSGLFEPSGEWGELYKIHGSIRDPNTLVITKRDYEKANKMSVLLNAKILSNLTESPILFLGYSLTDKNIRSLLQDFSENLPFEVEEAATRVGIVAYTPGQSALHDIVSEITDLGIHYTKIETDNFKRVYAQIAKINQGISPFEISKYASAFKQIIETKGQSNELEQVLTSFVDIDKLPDELKNKDLVVAFGDRKFIYKMPEYVDYIKSYFLPNNPMPLEIALRFIAKNPTKSLLPIKKYLSDVNQIPEEIKEKVNNRIKQTPNLNKIQEQVSAQIGKQNSKLLTELKDTGISAKDLYITKEYKEISLKTRSKIYFIISEFDHFSDNLAELIQFILKNASDTQLRKTEFRKLFAAYGLFTEGPADPI